MSRNLQRIPPHDDPQFDPDWCYDCGRRDDECVCEPEEFPSLLESAEGERRLSMAQVTALFLAFCVVQALAVAAVNIFTTCKWATMGHYSTLGLSEQMARESWDSGIVSIGGVFEPWMAEEKQHP